MKTIFLILTLVVGTALHAGTGRIHGRVMGLDETGGLAGFVSGAKIELKNDSGATVATATSSGSGDYEITGLDAAAYRYRVTAAGYKDEDEKRGFELSDAASDYAHDFLLWKDRPKMPEPPPTPPVVVVPRKPTVHGRVFSQDLQGVLTGMLAGAKVELLAGGKVAAMATADASGSYIIRELAPGDYQYRVTAGGYEPEDKGRGFTVPADELEYVQDFLLSPPPPKRDKCDLAVLVVKRISSGKNRANDARLPVANAKLMLQPKGRQPVPLNQPFTTDAKGELAVPMLAEGDYTVAVDAPECEPYTGPLKFKCDDEGQIILEIEPCNELLHGYVRAMLTDGWGSTGTAKAAAERAYQRALKADTSGDCGLSLAHAVSQVGVGDYAEARQSLAAAVGKKSESEAWDLACGMFLYMDLFLHQPDQAMRHARSLVQNHYADRGVTDTSKMTAGICGLVVAMVKGPWHDLVPLGDALQLESDLLNGLNGELRTALMEERDRVAGEYAQTMAEFEAGRNKLIAEATVKRNAEVARMEERQNAINRDVAVLDAELRTLQTQIDQAEQLRVQAAGFTQQRQGAAMQLQPLNARLQEITVCMAQDQREYQMVAADNPAEAAQIIAEINQHQGEIQQIQQQMAALKNQDAMAAANITNLQNQYNREVGAAVANHKTKLAQREAMVREFDGLEHDRMAPFDPVKGSKKELDEAADQCRMVTRYYELELEELRQGLVSGFDCGAAKEPRRAGVGPTIKMTERPFNMKGPVSNFATPAQTTIPRVMDVPQDNRPTTPVVIAPPVTAGTASPPDTGGPAEVLLKNSHPGAIRVFGIAPGGDNEQFLRSLQSGEEEVIKGRIGQTLIIRATTGGRELHRQKVGKKFEVLKVGGSPQ